MQPQNYNLIRQQICIIPNSSHAAMLQRKCQLLMNGNAQPSTIFFLTKSSITHNFHAGITLLRSPSLLKCFIQNQSTTETLILNTFGLHKILLRIKSFFPFYCGIMYLQRLEVALPPNPLKATAIFLFFDSFLLFPEFIPPNILIQTTPLQCTIKYYTSIIYYISLHYVFPNNFRFFQSK